MTTDDKPVQDEASKTDTPTTPQEQSQETTAAPETAAPVTSDAAAAPVAAVPPAQPSAPTPSVADMMTTAAPAAVPTPVEPAPAAEPTPPVEVTPPATPAPAAATPVEAPPATEPASAAVDSSAAAAATETTEDNRPADRLRGKLGSQATDRPVGSVDISTQRPDTPTASAPVEIPTTDDLDVDIEAEIASALVAETAPPVAETVDGSVAAVVAGAGAAAAEEEEEFGPGSRVSGKVQHIHGDDVFVNAGMPADVLVGMKQFPEDKKPAVGDELNLVVESIDADGLIRARIPEARTKTKGNWDGLAAGQVVDCQVTSTNKGGLQVSLANLKGFLPASQVDLGFVANMEEYVGQKLTVQITEVNPKKKNLVVSRKVLLLAEREEQQAGFWETLEVGSDHMGTVKTLKPYGAFVNLGPIDGFLHIGEISWSRIAHPNEVLNEGQQIQVRVIKIDKEKNRISLGMKQLAQNPWENLTEKYPSERVVNGKVTRVADFGAFVQLEPGVEGLVHISELAWRRVGGVAEVLKVGDEKDFQVLEVDPKRKRVSLSLKALEQKPESVKKAEAEEEARPVRKPNPNLQGGMGGKSGAGGLFGNPKDFT